MAPPQLCVLCVEPLEAVALGECNHRDVCWLCTIKLRKFNGDNKCCICKHESARVVVTADETLPFTAYDTVRLPAAGKDEGLPGVFWADDAVRDRFRKLTDLSCPECDVGGLRRLSHLVNHVKRHKKFYCETCLTHAKRFVQEQPLYSAEGLKKHIKGGGGQGGGHPYCEFCSVPCYDVDHLYAHLNEKHEKCTACEEDHQYFADERSLLEHGESEHHVCHEDGCRGVKNMVFRTKVDLQRHQNNDHGGRHATRAPRNSRPVDPSVLSFNYGTDAPPPQAARGRGPRRERGAAPEPRIQVVRGAHPLPARGDEDGGNATSRRERPRERSTSPAEPVGGGGAGGGGGGASTLHVDDPYMFPTLGGGGGNQGGSSGGGGGRSMAGRWTERQIESQEQQQQRERQYTLRTTVPSALSPEELKTRNKAVMRKLREAAGEQGQGEYETFRWMAKQYMSGEVTPQDLVGAFVAYFSADRLGIMDELVALLPEGKKREDLFREIDRERTMSAQYPSLSSSAPAPAPAPVPASGRGGGGSSAGWAGRARGGGAAQPRTTRKTPAPMPPGGNAGVSGAEDFPTLPTSSGRAPVGMARDYFRHKEPTNRWASGGSAPEPEPEPVAESSNKKGKKKKGKQVLMKFG